MALDYVRRAAVERTTEITGPTIRFRRIYRFLEVPNRPNGGLSLLAGVVD